MGWREATKRQVLKGIEGAFTAGWSVGEVAYALRHPRRLVEDPFRNAVMFDIEKNGLYRSFEGEVQRLEPGRGGWMTVENPYVRVGPGGTDKVVAKLIGHRAPRQRRAIVICHCYGLPFPAWMEQVFGLNGLPGYDVVYNIMNHHYLGSFAAWPGFGLVSPQMSRMIENVRSAMTGVRSLVRSLQQTFGYEEIVLLGYSIGGHLSLHVANSMPIDKLVAYCPVTSLKATATELGLMGVMSEPVKKTLTRWRGTFDFDDLDVLDPLQYELQVSLEKALLILQTHDLMVPPKQSEAFRARYPSVRCLEYPGTHTFPIERRAMQRALADFILN